MDPNCESNLSSLPITWNQTSSRAGFTQRISFTWTSSFSWVQWIMCSIFFSQRETHSECSNWLLSCKLFPWLVNPYELLTEMVYLRRIHNGSRGWAQLNRTVDLLLVWLSLQEELSVPSNSIIMLPSILNTVHSSVSNENQSKIQMKSTFFSRFAHRMKFFRWVQICKNPKFFAYQVFVNLPCKDQMYWHALCF